MNEIQPYAYQQRGIDEIIQKFDIHDRILYQLATAGGKTVIFSFLIKWWLAEYNSNVVILAHRTELINQAEETLSQVGVGCELVFSKVSKLQHHSRVYVAMIETASNRLKKNPYFFPKVGLVITDEAHILIYDKVFKYFPGAKFLGFTATPCVLKRITFWKCPFCKKNYTNEEMCCGDATQEWSRPYTLSEIYDDIVVGPEIKELIEFGSVVSEITFIKNYADTDVLKTDSDGEFTTDSVETAYNNEKAVFNVILNYKELCEGKKTIIFNSSSKANLAIYMRFIEEGYQNVRMFDSVNREQSGDRDDLLEWFEATPDAILLNVSVFTTGFDSKEVQAIILNRPTASLSLFIQIVGRGGRASNKIFKDNFILVDGGGNVDRFGEWSEYRDWESIFFNGTSKERAKVLNAMDIQDCPNCGALYPKNSSECPECGAQIEPSDTEPQSHSESKEVLVPIRKIPHPRPEQIYKYTISQGEDLNFAWKILINYIVDMFRYYRVDRDLYEKTVNNGKFEKKILELIRPSYFHLKGKKDLNSGVQRTMKYFVDTIKKKLNSKYGTEL